jgi:acyl-coenzyme A thioesterase PaaI-like protein
MTDDQQEPKTAASETAGDSGDDGDRGGEVGSASVQAGEMSSLAGRWQAPPPEQMTERRVGMRNLARSVRTIIDRLVATNAPTEAILELAEQLDQIAGRFDSWPHGTLYEGFAEAANAGGDPHGMFEHSPFIGQSNPLAPPIVLSEDDWGVHAEVRFGAAYEGPPGCVHGGYIAAAFDELLGAAQSLSGNPGMTGRLTVHYRSPTPLHQDLRMHGELVRVEGRKIFTHGSLFAIESDGSERLCAEAEGLFISIDFGKFAHLKEAREVAERTRLEGR